MSSSSSLSGSGNCFHVMLPRSDLYSRSSGAAEVFATSQGWFAKINVDKLSAFERQSGNVVFHHLFNDKLCDLTVSCSEQIQHCLQEPFRNLREMKSAFENFQPVDTNAIVRNSYAKNYKQKYSSYKKTYFWLGKVLENKPSISSSSSNSSNFFADWYNNDDFEERNITIKIQGALGKEDLKVHSVVLKMRSENFKTMLNTKGSIENQTKEIDLSKENPEFVKRLVEFIYKGKLGGSNSPSDERAVSSGNFASLDEEERACETKAMEGKEAQALYRMGHAYGVTGLAEYCNEKARIADLEDANPENCEHLMKPADFNEALAGKNISEMEAIYKDSIDKITRVYNTYLERHIKDLI